MESNSLFQNSSSAGQGVKLRPAGEDLPKVLAKANEGVLAVKATVRELTDTIGQRARAIGLQARKAASSTDSYVKSQPWKAVGVGAAAGFLVALVFARRA